MPCCKRLDELFYGLHCELIYGLDYGLFYRLSDELHPEFFDGFYNGFYREIKILSQTKPESQS